MRYSGVALGYNLATLVAGGPAPFIATALLAWSSGAFWPIAVYMIIMALITLVSVYIAAENREGDVSRARPDSSVQSVRAADQELVTKSGGNA